jgi:hypothetical protein
MNVVANTRCRTEARRVRARRATASAAADTTVALAISDRAVEPAMAIAI